ncbi:hypothetical protein SAMN04487783_0454 [Agrococcus baldri]|uniref:Lipoprotein n=1 Tax=Agrococcus baldri TaxID=153730 RepID=A0AA94KYN2_9MICO|nr:hypothetical protein [Agrococcus baldri]SFS00447.1 hypothetical protein SAMN04487783_0454 [Agrococcus baldri]
MRRLTPALAPLILAGLLLTGCTSSGASTGTPPAAEPAATSTTGTESATEPAASADTAAAAVPECDGIPFESGAVIPGEQLGECMAAAMLAAGSGTHRVDSSDGTSSTVQFEWTPQFSMSADGDLPMVVRGENGWAMLPESGWVQADEGSTDPQVVLATAAVNLTRVFGDPRTLGAAMAQSDWRVVDETSVPATDAVADVAWQLEPAGAFSMLGIAITDYQLWLGNDYLGAYAVGTAAVGDISATTSNTFLQWGEPVEIPDPTQL